MFYPLVVKHLWLQAGFPGTARDAGEFRIQLVEFVVIFKQHKISFLEFLHSLGVAITPETFSFKSDFISFPLAHRPRLDFSCTPGSQSRFKGEPQRCWM